MNFENAANTARSRFKTLIADVESLETRYDNAPLQNPTDEKQADGQPQAEDCLWARVTMLEGESQQKSLGTSKRFRTTGVMIVQLFAPLGTGDGEIRRLGRVVRDAFLCISADGIVWRTPSTIPVGVDGKWWQVNVTCPYYYDEIV